MEQILSYIPSELWTAIAIALGAAITNSVMRALSALEAYTGVKISDSARATIHSAIVTGIESQLTKKPTSSIDELIEAGANHALGEGASDSVARLGVSTDSLKEIGKRYAAGMAVNAITKTLTTK